MVQNYKLRLFDLDRFLWDEFFETIAANSLQDYEVAFDAMSDLQPLIISDPFNHFKFQKSVLHFYYEMLEKFRMQSQTMTHSEMIALVRAIIRFSGLFDLGIEQFFLENIFFESFTFEGIDTIKSIISMIQTRPLFY